MKLMELLNIYNNGVMNITYEKCSNVASIGGTDFSIEQVGVIIQQLGWIEWKLSPFEILDKTKKFTKSVKSNITDIDILNNTEIAFQNIQSMSYGKTFDRITLCWPRHFEYIIIYNMEGAGAVYCIYERNKAIPVAKCRTLKNVMEFINKAKEY